jgi:hypothetical protein
MGIMSPKMCFYDKSPATKVASGDESVPIVTPAQTIGLPDGQEIH